MVKCRTVNPKNPDPCVTVSRHGNGPAFYSPSLPTTNTIQMVPSSTTSSAACFFYFLKLQANGKRVAACCSLLYKKKPTTQKTDPKCQSWLSDFNYKE